MESKFNDMRVWVMGLVVKCPFDLPLPSCPASDIRKLPLDERIEVVCRMSVDQLEEIVTYHKKCLQMREQ